jgi:hypothetical protein
VGARSGGRISGDRLAQILGLTGDRLMEGNRLWVRGARTPGQRAGRRPSKGEKCSGQADAPGISPIQKRHDPLPTLAGAANERFRAVHERLGVREVKRVGSIAASPKRL